MALISNLPTQIAARRTEEALQAKAACSHGAQEELLAELRETKAQLANTTQALTKMSIFFFKAQLANTTLALTKMSNFRVRL